MDYYRVNQIEERFGKAVKLMTGRAMDSRQLAKDLGVSRPTLLRIIKELKRRGYIIRSVHDDLGWHYELIIPVKLDKSTGQTTVMVKR